MTKSISFSLSMCVFLSLSVSVCLSLCLSLSVSIFHVIPGPKCVCHLLHNSRPELFNCRLSYTSAPISSPISFIRFSLCADASELPEQVREALAGFASGVFVSFIDPSGQAARQGCLRPFDKVHRRRERKWREEEERRRRRRRRRGGRGEEKEEINAYQNSTMHYSLYLTFTLLLYPQLLAIGKRSALEAAASQIPYLVQRAGERVSLFVYLLRIRLVVCHALFPCTDVQPRSHHTLHLCSLCKSRLY